MSMSMAVPMVMMATRRVHSKQIDCQTNTTHPQQSVNGHKLGRIHTTTSASSGGFQENESLHSLYGFEYDEDRYQNQETA
jgi:hypothetical protein